MEPLEDRRLLSVGIGGRVWKDLDSNGVQDTGEPGLPSAVVEIFASTDGTSGHSTSQGVAVADGRGRYAFADLPDGLSYYVSFRVPRGFDFTAQGVGDPALDSNADATGQTGVFVVPAGQERTDIDAGTTGDAPWFGFAFNTVGASSGCAIATDAVGSVYVTGAVSDSVDFDPGPGQYLLPGGPQGSSGTLSPSDMFMAKYSSLGALVWARQFAPTVLSTYYHAGATSNAIAVASDGSVYATGSLEGIVDFDPGPGVFTLDSTTSPNFLLKLDASGNLASVCAVAGVSQGLALAQDGSIYRTGTFVGTVDFDPGPGIFNLAAARSGVISLGGTLEFGPAPSIFNLTTASSGVIDFPRTDVFIQKLDASGNLVWARRLGGTGDDRVYGIALGTDGSVCTTGAYTSPGDFDPGPAAANLTGGSGFISKLDAAGNYVWAKSIGSEARAIAVATDGGVYVGGSFTGTPDFDPGPAVFRLTSTNTGSGFVCKLNVAGTFAWAVALNSTDYAAVSGLVCTAANGVYALGSLRGMADFDPGPGVFNLSLAPDSWSGQGGSFALGLDNSGDFVWARKLEGSPVKIAGAALDLSGNLCIAGDFAETIDFDPGSGVFDLPASITAAHVHQAFVARQVPARPPTDITLPVDRFFEGQPAGALLGSLVVSDPDPGDLAVCSLVSGPGDTDNASFAIVNNALYSNAVFDAEQRSSYSIRVVAVDGSGMRYERPLTITILPAASAATIAGRVWLDANGNGVQDAGERDVAGVPVELVLLDGQLRGIAMTDSEGRYTLSGLLPGISSRIDVRLPVGYGLTIAQAGSDPTRDSDVDPSGTIASLMLQPGESCPHVDAGLTGSPPSFGSALPIGWADESAVRNIVTDTAGNMYVTGHFFATVDFDPGPGICNLTSVGGMDGFIAKYTPGGAMVWAKAFGGNGSDVGLDIAVVADGSVTVTGTFDQTVFFGGNVNLTSQGGNDVFVGKFGPLGTVLWARGFGGNGNDCPVDIAIASDGSVYTTGEFYNQVDFDPGPGVFNMGSYSSDANGFVSKLGVSGDFLWAKNIPKTSTAKVIGMALAPDDGIYLGGEFYQSINFASGTLASAGGSDVYVTRWSPAGTPLWAQALGGPGYDHASALAAGVDGSVYMTGTFERGADFDPGPGLVTLTANDSFAFELDASGGFVWAQSLAGACKSLAIGTDGSVYTAGSISKGTPAQTKDFDPGPETFELASDGYEGLFVCKLDAAHDFAWACRFGGTGNSTSNPIAVANDGDVCVTGSFYGTVDFDPSAGYYPLTCEVGRGNGFVTRFAQLQPSTAASLSVNAVLEHQPAGTPIGMLLATGVAANEPLYLSLAHGSGDADNAAFVVHEHVLYTNAAFDLRTKSSYAIHVRGTAADGAWYERSLTVRVLADSEAASLGDYVWQDLNANGVQETGEPGMAGTAVDLFTASDGLLRGTAVTDANGHYSIANLPSNLDYYAVFRGPVGYQFTAANVGTNDSLDSDVDATGATATFALNAGQSRTDVDAGLAGIAPSFGFAVAAGSTGDGYGRGVAVDVGGNVYVAGDFTQWSTGSSGGGTIGTGTLSALMAATASAASSTGSGTIFVGKYSSSGTLLWTRRFGGASSDKGQGLVLGPDGSVYIVGTFSWTADFDPGPAVYELTGTEASQAFVCKLDSAGNFVWAKALGSNGRAQGCGVAVAADGSIGITGAFEGTADFDPGPAVFTLTSDSSSDAFVCKLDAAGNFLWARGLGGVGSGASASGYGVTIGRDGNVSTVGAFWGTVDFDPGTGTSSLSSIGSADVYISVLDASGTFVRSERFGGAGTDRGYAIATTDDGSVYACGYFENTANFDSSRGTLALTAAGGDDAFVMRLDPFGNIVWAEGLGGLGDDYGNGLALLADGSVYVAGSFQRTADFDPGIGVFNLTSAGDKDSFVVKLDPSGNMLSARRTGGTNSDTAYGVAVAADESIYTTGYFWGKADFDPSEGGFNLTAAGTTDLYLAKLLPPPALTTFRLSQDRVLENCPAGTPVGRCLAVDESGNQQYAIEFTTGAGDADNASFAIADNVLLTSATFIASTKDSYSIRLRARNYAGLSREQAIQVIVLPGNQAAAVGDRVWWDLNADGLQDPGEPGIAGAAVDIYSAADHVLRGATSTDAAGQFTISNIPPGGPYEMVCRFPLGYHPTTAHAGDDVGRDSDANAAGVISNVSLLAGQRRTDLDIGLIGSDPASGFAFPIWGGEANNSYVNAVVTDSAGNVYVTGSFSGTTDFDPGPGTCARSADDVSDAFVAKYSAGGALLWVRTVSASLSASGEAVVVGPDGGISVAGLLNGTADFDPGPGTNNLTGTAPFVWRLDASGNFVWATAIPVGVGSSSYRLATAQDGSLVVAGGFQHSHTLKTATGDVTLASAGWDDIFVCKLTASGQTAWARQLGGAGWDFVKQIAVLPDGSICVVGNFEGTADFDPGPGTFNLTGGGSFLAKLDSAGSLVWVTKSGGVVADAALGPDGSIYTVGSFNGSADFDPGPGVCNLTSDGSKDAFITRFDAGGNLLSASRFGGANPDDASAVAIGSDGSIYVTGTFSGTLDFDPGPGTFNMTSTGTSDIFLSKLDASGEFLWADRQGGDGAEWPSDLAVGADGDVWNAGWFRGTVDFGPDPAAQRLTGPAATSSNAGFLSMRVTVPMTTLSFPLSRCYGPIEWDGAITGAAADPLPQGLDKVQVSVRQDPGGTYWGGTAFDQSEEVFLTASGTAKWSLALPATAFTVGSAYTVHARAVDKGGSAGPIVTAEFDYWNAPATIADVSAANCSGRYTTGTAVDIEVRFTDIVTVTGMPKLLLAMSDSTRTAVYRSGTGSDTLTFRYMVQADDFSGDLDCAGTDALLLNGGAIQDIARNDAVLTLPTPGSPHSLGANKDILVSGYNANPSIQTPAIRGEGHWTLRRRGDSIELISDASGLVFFSQPLSSLDSLAITSANRRVDFFTVNFAMGGSFVIPGGVVFNGRQGKGRDVLMVQATSGPNALELRAGAIVADGLQIKANGLAQVVLDGGKGDDTYQISASDVPVTLRDPGGVETLDFSAASSGVSLDLGSKCKQYLRPWRNTLALHGTFESVAGTRFADTIYDNAADNIIKGGGGNDRLFASRGNDIVFGDAGNDWIVGGGGNSVLLGGDGDDRIVAGRGAKILVGGAGVDKMIGGAGADILIAGTTTYDANETALRAILAEWAAASPLTTRLGHVRNGGGLNGSVFLNPGDTVFDDHARDHLFGCSKSTWLIAFGDDRDHGLSKPL